MTSTFQTALTAGIETLGLECSAAQLDLLLRYHELFLKWNSAFNLVSAGELNQLVSRHFLDSLAIQPYLDGENILDIGTGAGFPGIPLAVLNPDKKFVLLDSNGKKTRFLFQVQLALQLDNITIENCRVEHYQSPGQIDIVTCRAFASLAEVLIKAQSFFLDGAQLLAMKGRFPDVEIEELASIVITNNKTDLTATPELIATHQLTIPGNDSERHLIAVKLMHRQTHAQQ